MQSKTKTACSPKGRKAQRDLCWARNVIKKYESQPFESVEAMRLDDSVNRRRYERALAMILSDQIANS